MDDGMPLLDLNAFQSGSNFSSQNSKRIIDAKSKPKLQTMTLFSQAAALLLGSTSSSHISKRSLAVLFVATSARAFSIGGGSTHQLISYGSRRNGIFVGRYKNNRNLVDLSSIIANTRGGALPSSTIFSRNIIQRFSSTTAESVETTSSDVAATELSAATMTAGEKLAAMRSKMAESGVDGKIFRKYYVRMCNCIFSLPHPWCVFCTILYTSYVIPVYLVPSDDPHLSEYVPSAYKRRGYLTDFNGSAGTAVVTMDKAYLWTDSRYVLEIIVAVFSMY